MTSEECLKMLREIKSAAFATVDSKGNPQVRIIDIMLVEENRLYICTARGKELYHQLVSNGRAAVTAMNPEVQMIRLNGTVRRLEDHEQKEWIDRIFEANPVMNGVYPGDSRYILEAFCIEEGEMEFFDLGKKPIFRESFTLGEAQASDKGFTITKDCTECGICREVCPQQCIEEGTPYRIRQKNCLHCGLCSEKCPSGAIVKRQESR